MACKYEEQGIFGKNKHSIIVEDSTEVVQYRYRVLGRNDTRWKGMLGTV